MNKETEFSYWYDIEDIKPYPYGKRLNIWLTDLIAHISERIGGATVALYSHIEVEKRISAKLAKYKNRYPSLLSAAEVKK